MALVDGLRARIAAALGLGPLLLASGAGGCVVRSLDDPDDVGDASDDGQSTGSGSTGSDAGSGSSSATVTASVSGDGTTSGGSEDDGTLQMCWPTGKWMEWELWLPPGPQGECFCDEECQATALAQWNEVNCCSSCWYGFSDVLCVERLADQCHYITTMYEEGCGKGRPLLIDDEARTAAACGRDDWAQAIAAPWVEGLSPARRRILAEHWTAAALAEHASVASFARFVLDLAALGAPPELLAEATAAMQDEIRHAQVAFGLASTYAGRSVGPGPLPMHGLRANADADAIVRAAVREGCVEETLAAAEAELAAHRATDPAVRLALTAIAEDEARHAVLAWRFVDWAVQRDPSLATAVRDELQRATAAMGMADDTLDLPPTTDDVIAGHGLLPAALRLRLRAQCLQRTIRPCAAAMLHGRGRGVTASG
jgi:hypothetical protein